MKTIYLDHSATTKLDEKILKAMMPYFVNKFGNPSSLHSYGQEAIKGVEKARAQIAKFLNCGANEIIFTSGATESDNLAIKGIINAARKNIAKPHIITSMIEHKAILAPCMELEKEGVEITYVGVNNYGVVSVEEIKKAIRPNTVLVSIMYVNSEVGSIQPIREIGKMIEKINELKFKRWREASVKTRGEKPLKIIFHTDAVQALNFLNCDVKHNHLDLLSLSGHKIYGPKGIGALYVKNEIKIKPIQIGGGQEQNLRSGTLNVPGIVGLGEAVNQLKPNVVKKNNKKIARLRDLLVEGIIKNIKDVKLNTEKRNSTPSHAHFSFLGVEGESILISLDLAGIAVSTGSACASGSLKPSHVLLAMGIKPEVAHNSIRFTLGKNTTVAEINKVLKILPPVIKRLRAMNPLL